IRDCPCQGKDTPGRIDTSTEGHSDHRMFDLAEMKSLYEEHAPQILGIFEGSSPCCTHKHCSSSTCRPINFDSEYAFRSHMTGAMIIATGIVFICPFTCRLHICYPGVCNISVLNPEGDGSTCPVSGVNDKEPLIIPVEKELNNGTYQEVARQAEHGLIFNTNLWYTAREKAVQNWKVIRKSSHIKHDVMAILNSESLVARKKAAATNTTLLAESSCASTASTKWKNMIGAESNQVQDEITIVESPWTFDVDKKTYYELKEKEKIVKADLLASKMARGDFSDLGAWASHIASMPELGILVSEIESKQKQTDPLFVGSSLIPSSSSSASSLNES